jgi:hypothetical protein
MHGFAIAQTLTSQARTMQCGSPRWAPPQTPELTMKHIRPSCITLATSSLLIVAACAGSPSGSLGSMGSMGAMGSMSNPTKTLSAQLSGASEVPVVTTNAAGRVEASFNPSSNLLTWKITYSDLSGTATGAHFHGPAMEGQNAGVVIPVTAPLTSPISGSATLTPSQAADILAGKWYVNLHTAANPNGEARGQVSVAP